MKNYRIGARNNNRRSHYGIILRGVIIFVVVFLLMMGSLCYRDAAHRKKIGIFQTYVQRAFSAYLARYFLAGGKQKSKPPVWISRLLQDDAQQQIIIV
jgi:hypothetical protein